MGNTAKQCRLGLFQDSDFAGDLEDSKSTSGGTFCAFGSHTFVPISWMCNRHQILTAQQNLKLYLSGHGTEIGWFACSGIVGSNCFCLWNLFLIFQIERGNL